MNKLLIIATHARMLTQAARNTGFVPLVIDCYGDCDTQKLAEIYLKVNSLAVADVSDAVDFFKKTIGVTQLVYGSGFEQHCESLIFLAQQFEIIGNSAQIFIALQNKKDFFAQLQRLNIPYPEVRFQKPKENQQDWLVKPNHSQGGFQIQFLSAANESNAVKTKVYYQKYLNGEPLSVLFVANGKQARVVGFNQQWTIQLKNQPFVFSGIVNHTQLSLAQQQMLTAWIAQLTTVYGLRGLNSLDFMRYKNHCYVLEINPRPSASLQLYDEQLLRAHVAACVEKALPSSFKTTAYKVYQVLYAQKPLVISKHINWFEECVDLPETGAIIDTGQPICSMIVSDKNVAQLLTTLRLKTDLLFSQLNKTTSCNTKPVLIN